MKHFFAIFLFVLMSLSLSASHVHLSLTGVTSGSHFSYCTTTDSVIVHKPAGAGLGYWFPGGNPPSQQGDSIVITQSSQSFWEFTDGTIQTFFYIHFTSIAPTEPWVVIDTTKCTETAVLLSAQTV